MEKKYNFSKILFHIIFLRNIHKGFLSVEDTDKEQSKLFKELSDLNKGEKPVSNKSFLKNVEFILMQEKKFLIALKVIYFQYKI